jgi:polyhydroxyalkanoate synthesis regulator phasin
VRDEIRRIALFASGVGDLTRNRAEQIAKELVKTGEVRRDQAAGWAKTLFDASAENRKEIIKFIRSEMQNQVKALGLATTTDLDRLERRLDRVEATARRAAVKTSAAKKSTVVKKSTVKKSTAAKKSTVRKEPGGSSVPPKPAAGDKPPPPPGPGPAGGLP